MKKVNEVSKLIGVSKRTLQYYDEIGLLTPTKDKASGYRFYTDADIEKLWNILLFKEFGYQLSEIKDFYEKPNIDLRDSLGKRIEIMKLQKLKLENLIDFANICKFTGFVPYNFEKFGQVTFEEFILKARNQWNTNTLLDESFSEKTEDEEVEESLDIETIQFLMDKYLKEPQKTWDAEEIDDVLDSLPSKMLSKGLILENQIDKLAELVDLDIDSDKVQEQVGKLYDIIIELSNQPLSINAFYVYSNLFDAGGDAGAYNTKFRSKRVTDFIANSIRKYCYIHDTEKN